MLVSVDDSHHELAMVLQHLGLDLELLDDSQDLLLHDLVVID